VLFRSYRVDLSGPSEKYTIPNNNIDTSTIRVTVQNSYTDLTTEQYTLSENLSAVLPTSKVFFLEENPSGLYEIFFGDGILGKKLISGNIVRIEYLVSHGDECNVSSGITQNFSLGTTIGGVSLDSSIVASSNSTGGGAGDTIDEIKFKAPRFLSSFNRAVTANDYKALIEANFPLVESIAVWGGEENNPPMYGKVIISLKPYEGYSISDTVKTSIIKDILSNKKVMSIIPEFVDPNYLYISIDARIKFSSKNSKYNSQDIELLVENTIQNYFRQELQKFNKNFIYSKLSKSIDSIDSSIIGNVVSLKIQKRISPVVGAENGFSGSSVIKFENKLVSGSIKSTAFYYNTNTANTNINSVYIQDNLTTASTSSLDLIDFYSGTKLVSGIGTANYNTGEISIPSLIPAGYIENSPDIRISAKIEEMDIQSTNNLILIIDDTKLDTFSKRTSGLTVTVISE
jgi:hypothetical protein